MIPDINQYRQEKEKWKAAGKPERTDERVAEIYDTHCAPCENYIPIPLLTNRGQCGICSCLLSRDSESANKIRWATTRCPLEEPKWTEDVEIKEALKVEPQGRRRIPPKDCGCG